MTREMYDIMPIAEIHTPKEQCNQIGKRNAKKAIQNLIDDCDYYCIDLKCALDVFRKELSKMYNKYDGD